MAAAHRGSPYVCIRTPVIVAAGPLLVAFGEARHWYGDGCCPTAAFPVPGVCMNDTFRAQQQAARAADPCQTDVVMKLSRDFGASWSPLSVAARCLHQPAALVTQRGEVLLYVSNVSTVGPVPSGQTTANFLVRATPSPSGALAFSAPVPVHNGTGPFVNASVPVVVNNGPGRAIQLGSAHPIAPGRILSAGWLMPAHWPEQNQDVIVFYSDDDARTHAASRTIVRGMEESQLVELASGEVQLFSRNRADCIAPNGFNQQGMCVAVTRSTDAGAVRQRCFLNFVALAVLPSSSLT